jgi:hypothetical protein
MRRIAIIASVVGFALAWAPSSASAFDCGVTLDDFNRPNSTNLGPEWTEQANDIQILNNSATNLAATPALMTFNPSTADEACVDVGGSTNPGTQYVAIVLRYANLANNVFIKVQDNGGTGGFQSAWYYYGNNGGMWPGGQLSSPLTPFTQGRMHVAVAGTNVTLDVDTDFDNQPEQSFTVGNLPTASLGTVMGLGNYGHALMDNFATAAPPGTPPAPPTPPTIGDTTPPETTITKHPKKVTANPKVKFKFTSNEPGSTFECKLDKKAFKPCESPYKKTVKADAKHKFKVRATDAAGNTDTTPAKFKWTVTG